VREFSLRLRDFNRRYMEESFDRERYRQRNVVERLIGWLKEMVAHARAGQVRGPAPDTHARPETPPEVISSLTCDSGAAGFTMRQRSAYRRRATKAETCASGGNGEFDTASNSRCT